MKIKEIKEKNLDELQQILKIQQEKLRELRFKDSNKQLNNVREIRNLRLTIARILTFINKNKN